MPHVSSRSSARSRPISGIGSSRGTSLRGASSTMAKVFCGDTPARLPARGGSVAAGAISACVARASLAFEREGHEHPAALVAAHGHLAAVAPHDLLGDVQRQAGAAVAQARATEGLEQGQTA